MCRHCGLGGQEEESQSSVREAQKARKTPGEAQNGCSCSHWAPHPCQDEKKWGEGDRGPGTEEQRVRALGGFPGGSAVKNPPASAGDSGSIPGLGQSSGGGKGNPVFLPGKSHGQRSLGDYSPWGRKE